MYSYIYYYSLASSNSLSDS